MDVLVVGAGIVGLAAGRALALRGHAVIVAEAADAFGTGISSRSSEVIHAGMYYPAGSLRAQHCVEGARRLYAYCVSHGIPHRACGKLIVAADDGEAGAIAALRDKGEANGVPDLALLDREEARRRRFTQWTGDSSAKLSHNARASKLCRRDLGRPPESRHRRLTVLHLGRDATGAAVPAGPSGKAVRGRKGPRPGRRGPFHDLKRRSRSRRAALAEEPIVGSASAVTVKPGSPTSQGR